MFSSFVGNGSKTTPWDFGVHHSTSNGVRSYIISTIPSRLLSTTLQSWHSRQVIRLSEDQHHQGSTPREKMGSAVLNDSFVLRDAQHDELDSVAELLRDAYAE